MGKAGFSFAQLPIDEVAFIEFVQGTGDIWCRASGDHPRKPKYQPLGVAQFLRRYARRCRRHGSLTVYLGFEPAVLRPPAWSRVHTVKGKRTREAGVDEFAGHFVRYAGGGICD